MKIFWRVGLAVLVLFFATAGYADTTVCVETSGGGCVADLLNGAFAGFAVNVASDGEASFDPFGAGFDTSDGIQFVGFASIQGQPWVSYGSTAWLPVADPNGGVPQTWVLPADLSSIGCGVENFTTCEPVGAWYQPGFFWNVPANTYVILDPDGNWSDTITLGNFGPNGNAAITFASDPVPEPGSLLLLGSGLIGVAGTIRRKLIG